MGNKNVKCKLCGKFTRSPMHTCIPLEHKEKIVCLTCGKPAKSICCKVCTRVEQQEQRRIDRDLQEQVQGLGCSKKKYTKVLRHCVKKQTNLTIGAFDIETDMLTDVYLGGWIGYEDGQYTYCRTMSDLFTTILARPNTIVYAHAGAIMEFNYLINELEGRNLTITPIMQGSARIIGMIIEAGTDEDGKKQRIELRDSYAIIPLSLKQAGIKLCGESDQKKDHDFGKDTYEKRKNVRNEWEYGAKKRDVSKYQWNPDDPKDIEYCRQDVQATIAIVQAFRKRIFDTWGVEIGWTASSTAMNVYKSMIPQGASYWRLEPSDEFFCRDGYYGGFVYTGHDILKHEDIVSCDRNAAYVACMRQPLPVGKCSVTYTYQGKPGMYKCRITPSKDIPFAFLPCRSIHGLLWPRGGTGTMNGNTTASSWEATITHMEIEFGRAHGYDIQVIEGRCFDRMETPLKEFSEKIEQLVLNDPSFKPVGKLVGNGLYGKFGTKLEISEVKYSPECPGPDWEHVIDPKKGTPLACLWQLTHNSEAEYINPVWASYITAYQRLWLFETVLAVGVDHVHYCDTDSVKADRSAVEAAFAAGTIDQDPSRYGASKIDEEYTWFQCMGPKVYWGILTDGTVKKRAKGLPMYALLEQNFKDVLEGKFYPVAFKSFVSSGVRLKNPALPIRKQSTRTITNIRQSCTRRITPDARILMPLVYNGHLLEETEELDTIAC